MKKLTREDVEKIKAGLNTCECGTCSEKRALIEYIDALSVEIDELRREMQGKEL